MVSTDDDDIETHPGENLQNDQPREETPVLALLTCLVLILGRLLTSILRMPGETQNINVLVIRQRAVALKDQRGILGLEQLVFSASHLVRVLFLLVVLAAAEPGDRAVADLVLVLGRVLVLQAGPVRVAQELDDGALLAALARFVLERVRAAVQQQAHPYLLGVGGRFGRLEPRGFVVQGLAAQVREFAGDGDHAADRLGVLALLLEIDITLYRADYTSARHPSSAINPHV